jgi:hypothetical protein
VLVFLGLLGTFWGLLLTIGSFGDIVKNLNVSDGNILAVFDSLKSNISRPLSGMGTAFSTSLFGLGASLILGFLHLQSTLAQHSFYNELEENMTRYTRIVSESSLAEGDGSIITYLQAMLEQTADNINILQKDDLFLINDKYLIPYLTFIKENKKIYKLIHSKPHLFNTKEVFSNLYKDFFSKILDKYCVETKEQEYVFAYFSFGLVSIIEKWIEKDCEDDIYFIANIMKRVIGHQK